MAEYVESNFKSFTAGAAIAQPLRVTLSGGKLAAAGITDKELGTLRDASFADGDVRAVHLRTANGTCKMIASEAIAVGAAVYTAASGKCSDTAASTSYLIGTALTEATADGDVIEVLRNAHGDTAN